MRIGIEACTWGNLRGYGRFTRELVSAMVRDYPQHEITLVLDDVTASRGKFPERVALNVVATSEQQIRAASADSSRRLPDLWRLGRAVAKADYDVFFFPTRYSFYPMTCRTPTVVAFHDATAERHPELIFSGFRTRLFWRIKSRLALHQADRLMTVSHDAREQIAEAFGLPAEEIGVISEGPDPIFRELDNAELLADVRERMGLPAEIPLILYVGGISPHKNLNGLFRALVDTPGPWHAVLVGDYENDDFLDCYDELRALAEELELSERITFTGFVSDADLVLLYNASTLFILPSFSEGFGLPVIEAMACWVPVTASSRNSIPEVLGDAGVLFDPTDSREMTEAMTRLLADEVLRDELRARGRKQAQLFTWQRGAQQVMEVLEGIARRR
jgi:glycosyltransferase involved in cell wall biosynthesis